MKVTVWTFTTDDDGIVVGVYGTKREALAGLRGWASYWVDDLPDDDTELEAAVIAADENLYFVIDQYDVDVPVPAVSEPACQVCGACGVGDFCPSCGSEQENHGG